LPSGRARSLQPFRYRISWALVNPKGAAGRWNLQAGSAGVRKSEALPTANRTAGEGIPVMIEGWQDFIENIDISDEDKNRFNAFLQAKGLTKEELSLEELIMEYNSFEREKS
jgi:hypothetical protein